MPTENAKYDIIYIGKTDSYKENTDWSAGISETKGEIQIMEMKELYYFIAIAEEKSISKAGGRLFMAKSSLSQFLSILENNVGSKLFIRTSRGVRLTQEGELMLQYAYKTLAEYRSVQNEIKDMKQLKKRSCDHGGQQFQRFLSSSACVERIPPGASGCESGDRGAKFHGIRAAAVVRRDRYCPFSYV